MTWWQRQRTCLYTSEMSDLKVSVSDFPVFDGSSRPVDFLRQCRRLAKLGEIPDEKLCAIIAARCKGVALELINAVEDGKGPLTLAIIEDELTSRFGSGAVNAQQAAVGQVLESN